MKKFAALVLSLLLCAALCVPAFAETTLVKHYTLEEIIQNTFHNGFVTAMGGNEVNTLILNDDGTYTYTKEIHQEAEDGTAVAATEETPVLLVTYTFTGTYTQDGDTVVLAFPTAVKFSENWGNLAAMGYFQNTEGEASFVDGEFAGDIVQCKEAESHNPFDVFPGAFMVDSLVMGDGFDADANTVTVTLNGDTFDYVIVNSDDD